MKQRFNSNARLAIPRRLLSTVLYSAGTALLILTLAPGDSLPQRGPRLAAVKLDFARRAAGNNQLSNRKTNTSSTFTGQFAASANAPTFGHPIISGIGGLGFEESIRIDPTNPDRIYTSAPGTASADTSWIWHSLDGGRTFKWVVGAAPLEGKVTTCHGGGDTELALDQNGRLYFNDLTLANFSTSRSDDFGATFTCSNTGVPDTAVDRQWYSIDGDPLNGGSLYLVNDEIGPGAPMCGSSVGNNVLVMYRSPVAGLGPSAGVEFGPANHVSAVGSCDEAIMGNNEVSLIATTLGQPLAAGGYATLPAAVKHIFVVHDNAALNKILLGRCFPVAFGAPVANVSDPSGLNCTDLTVADLGPGQKTGGDFPTLAIDKSGNLYAVWEQAPIDANGAIIGDTVLKYAYSTDQGNTWSSPIQIDTSGSSDGVLHNNVFAWINAGDDGRVNIVWYGTPALSNPADQTCGVTAPLPPAQGRNINGPDSVDGRWSLWMVQSLNAHDPAGPAFTAPILASAHHIHRGSVQTLLGGQCGNRALGDFLQLRTGPQGEAHISYADSDNVTGILGGHAMYVRQNGGSGLYASPSTVNVPDITPFNAVTDPPGDGKYEVAGVSNSNMPQLDILASNISEVRAAPCSVAAPCYKIFMQLNNLSLAPTTAQDPDPDLVWLTQWFVPSTTDSNGGKNFHVYAESFNGAALQCFAGQNAIQLVGGGGVLTYPGTTQLPAANCQSTLGPNGNITIYVPESLVTVAGAIDNRLHEVTASTMTLQQPANTVPPDPFVGIGGSFFNLIDVAQGYVFDPVSFTVASRKTHGTGQIFDINLPVSGRAGVECRAPGPSNTFQLVFTFGRDIVAPGTATKVQGTAVVGVPVIGPNSNQVTVNLRSVTDAQHLVISLTGVQDAAGAILNNLTARMDVLFGDVDASARVDSGDVTVVRQDALQTLTASPPNFRADVDLSGRIDSNDVTLTRQQAQNLPSLP